MGATVVPRHVLGGPGQQAPSDTLGVAIVGAGGMGGGNARELGSERIVAVCDVDHGLVAAQVERSSTDGNGRRREQGVRWKEQYAAARKYTDFRVMLDQEDEVDAVLIATPDHTHAVIAGAAMRAGKHVYVQKPLTWSVHEARELGRLAESTGVITQMGNQGHSGDDARLVNEWVQAGVIGVVREVHVWTNRPIWMQGLPRPAPFPRRRQPHRREPLVVARFGAGGRRGRAVGRLHGARPPRLGPLPGADRARGAVPPHLPPLPLARLGRLRGGGAGRHGGAPDRPPRLGARPGPAGGDRGHLHPVGRPRGQPGLVSGLDQGAPTSSGGAASCPPSTCTGTTAG